MRLSKFDFHKANMQKSTAGSYLAIIRMIPLTTATKETCFLHYPIYIVNTLCGGAGNRNNRNKKEISGCLVWNPEKGKKEFLKVTEVVLYPDCDHSVIVHIC